jgi:xanthine dehydrogenase accessory factor
MLKYPAGLDIAAAGAEEIAVSIVAEIIQRRHALGGLPAAPAEPEPAAAPARLEAIDPVCGMSVVIAGARYTHEYEGQTYYFCCPACRKSFAREPEQYLVKG